jgi:HPt (histidine-containing phosphotransfer) domain-containing protein
MKDDDRSLPQRLTGMLACTARRLLQTSRDTPKPPDTRTPDTGSIPGLPDDACRRRQSFSGEIFAELLIELPGFQKEISQAYQSGDRYSLGRHLHRLLGAVAYCDAPELEAALRKLHQAIKTEEPGSQDIIDTCYARACSAISSTLHYSGCRGG